MIEGDGFTASEVSFKLACMRVLGTLRESFTVKSWRVIDESDLIGSRYVQASMLLSIGDAIVTTTRAEGAGPVDALTKATRRERRPTFELQSASMPMATNHGPPPASAAI
jgi:2-isopropylmalate synthase